jgi:hypothetical protein
VINNQTTGIDLARLRGVDDLTEIHSIPDVPAVLKSLPELLPVEQEVSLPPSDIPVDPTLLMLNRILGAQLSSDNLAWKSNAVACMRSLQKRLVEYALTLPESDRAVCLMAIDKIEQPIMWRLRWNQMRRSHAESHFNQEDKKSDEKKETT